MSYAPQIRTKYREGVCEEFGRVRPVHLGEIFSVERRLEVSGRSATLYTRLGWKGQLPPPRVGEFLSLHHQHGKSLAEVTRVCRSCACCPGAATFVHIRDVEGVHPQVFVCECARDREWLESAAWNAAPGDGLCRRAGADSLARISEAIKEKSRRGK